MSKSILKHAHFLLLPIVLSGGFTRTANAQGWTFTETVTQTGECIPYVPYPSVVFYTKDACEAARQGELDNSGSDWSLYGDGNCTTIITCTPCVGSDIGGSGATSTPGGAGELSLTGTLTGDPFFSSHQSMDVENWIGDIYQKLKSLGYSDDDISALTSGDLPLTGNVDFDKWYAEQMMKFKPSGSAATVYLRKNQDTIDPNDLKNPAKEPEDKTDREGYGTVQMPGSDNQWYHLEPLANGGIPPLPESTFDPNARYEHPKIELYRQAAVTAAGWLPDGAAYPGILAVNIWAENAKAIQDIRDGNNPQDAMTSLQNAAANSLKDLKDQAIGDAGGKVLDKFADIISPDKGIAKIATTASDMFSKNQDLGGEVAYGEGEGIFGKISKAAGWLGSPSNIP